VSNRSFSPNIGLAYQAAKTLVIRTGFGMNYDPAPLAYNRDMLSNYPEILAFSFTGVKLLPAGPHVSFAGYPATGSAGHHPTASQARARL